VTPFRVHPVQTVRFEYGRLAGQPAAAWRSARMTSTQRHAMCEIGAGGPRRPVSSHRSGGFRGLATLSSCAITVGVAIGARPHGRPMPKAISSALMPFLSRSSGVSTFAKITYR
jgi:hypothetical protein